MKNTILYLIIASFVSSSISSQNFKETKADKQFDKLAYVDAIKTYERIFAKGYKSQEILEKLGDSYYFKSDLDKSAKWYGELFSFTKEIAPEYYYRYSQSLKAIKEYTKADEMLLKFNEKSGNDLRAKLAMTQKDYLAQIKKNSGRYTIENAGINSKYSDYGSAFFNDKVIFTSARDTGNFTKRVHSWTGESFTNLYGADRGDQGVLSNPKRFGNKLNTKFHESTPTFTKDGKTVYFTRNNFLDGKKGKDATKTTLLKIYKATLDADKWVNITELSFNSDEYSVSHPALSADEKTLYFASNMPGTLGQSDLFKVEIKSDGSFGAPTNLGNVINTEGRETFPMVTSENELYFASNGHPGLGGLDVFVAKTQADGSYKKVENVGEPVNSSKDDFGYLINDKTRLGYVSSNREGGKGGDDIYSFKELKKLECEQLLSVVVTDKLTGLPIEFATVTLSDSSFNKLLEAKTDAYGVFKFGNVDCGTKYYIKTEKNDYNTSENVVITGQENGETLVPIALEKSIIPINVEDDIAKIFGIRIIYFDLDKSFIRPDAAVELAKILDVMEQHPNLEIDIRSHTDCRHTAKYNMALSERRANSTMDWLINNGISKSRLTGRGYGETQLVNDCNCEPTNNSDCTEEQHQANRRSEFIVTKL
jgi:outer membrane protein OmpA-like peptidoglycan-associated protein/tetratricopeptide (TPR) repeat protein